MTGRDIIKTNIDFLAYTPQDESRWNFYIAGKARKASELIGEILDITEKVLDDCKGFFIPTEIEYILLAYSEDLPANDVFNTLGINIKPLKVFERKLESEKGISFQEFREDVQSIKPPTNVGGDIRRIEISGKTRFILEGKDAYIDCGSKGLYADPDYKEVLTPQQVMGSLPLENPFWITISHYSSKGEKRRVESSDPAYYQIVFCAWANIWFENTDIGLANRNMLRNVLRKVYDNFDVAFTLFLSDRFSEERLKDIVFGQD